MSNGLDLLLVNVGGTRKKVYQELSKDFSAIEPPFWAALTAGYIRNQGFDVQILDANVKNLTPKETANKIKEIDPKFTALVIYGQQATTATPLMIGARALCEEIKKDEADRKIIMTGWHPSALPERTLQKELCDYVVEGEEFYALKGLLEEKSLNEIPGLWWKENGTIRGNPVLGIKDLDKELSDVAWDLLPKEGYRAFNWLALGDFKSRSRFASLHTSLGCSYDCDFCQTPSRYSSKKVRKWSANSVLKKIDWLVKNWDTKHIKIIDELFVQNPNHYLPIAQGLIERDYNLNICAFTRVDSIKPEYLPTLKKAGLNWFMVGIETGNQDIRGNVGKGNYSKQRVLETMQQIRDAGISTCSNFMFGLPGDTLETMQETLDLAMEIQPEFPSFFCTMALPGAPLYSRCLEDGVKLPNSWIGYATQAYEFEPLPTKHCSAEEVLAFRDHAFDTYFRNPKYLKMIEEKFGVESREHIEAMAKIKLKRKILGD